MGHSLEVHFPVDHPTAAGHFPGNPIIPGAVLLGEVLQAVAGADARFVIRSAKFLHPVRPGDAVVIRWEAAATGGTKFECRLLAGERLALVGTVEPEDAAP